MGVRIGYQSLQDVSGTTVTSNVAAVAYPVENAVDWLAFDYYQPDAAGVSIEIKFTHASAQAVDYIAIAKHDLFTLGTRLTVDYSADDISYSSALAATTIADDGVRFVSFTQASAKYWRVTIDRLDSATIQPVLGVLLLGTMLDMERGPQFGFSPQLIDDDIGRTSTSMTGIPFVKTIKKTGGKSTIRFKHLTPAFVRASWVPLMSHLQSKLCIISWDEDNFPDEAVMAWLKSGKDIKQPKYPLTGYMDVDLNVQVTTE